MRDFSTTTRHDLLFELFAVLRCGHNTDFTSHVRLNLFFVTVHKTCSTPKTSTTVGFLHRARAWFAGHGITHVTRLVTDNGNAYRSKVVARAIRVWNSRHQRIRPYTPRHNGKVERYQRVLADEFLYARPYTSEAERTRTIHQ